MRRKKWTNRCAVALLTVCLMLCTACGGSGTDTGSGAAGSGTQAEQAQNPAAQLSQTEKETSSQLIQLLSAAEEAGPGNEWSIIGIARSSLAKDPQAQSLFFTYQDTLRLQVKRAKGVLDPERPTDNARAAIALQLTGGDPADVEGYDLLSQQEDIDAVRGQGINAEIWALAAAACCGRELKAADTYLEDILRMCSDDGGITYDGANADVDITAMALQAMAPYAEGRDDITGAMEKARGWLAGQQKDAGDYGNSESTSQVILALAAMGEDPLTAEGFAKNGNLLDGQMLYHRADGFAHLDEKEMDVMATEQALCALDSMQLAARGETLF